MPEREKVKPNDVQPTQETSVRSALCVIKETIDANFENGLASLGCREIRFGDDQFNSGLKIKGLNIVPITLDQRSSIPQALTITSENGKAIIKPEDQVDIVFLQDSKFNIAPSSKSHNDTQDTILALLKNLNGLIAPDGMLILLETIEAKAGSNQQDNQVARGDNQAILNIKPLFELIKTYSTMLDNAGFPRITSYPVTTTDIKKPDSLLITAYKNFSQT